MLINRNATHTVKCTVPFSLEDAGYITLESFRRAIADPQTPKYVRPCGMEGAWVEKWWCVCNCPHMIEAKDTATGEIITGPGKPWDGKKIKNAR